MAALIRHLHCNKVISDQRKETLYRQLYTRKNPDTGRSYGATEPGWDRYAPERPALISAWLKYITGTTIPEVAAMPARIFPPDLLASILNEQRAASGAARETSIRNADGENVVSLRDRFPDRRPEERQLRQL
jgi:hypothetical protein